VTFDFLIVDIFMPNMRGFEPVGKFHARAPTVSLVAKAAQRFAV
jgi:YesN/AraC family two-component response regulator